ncbi:MAG: 50S ribosomal protein L1 [bacterium]|jgi:large subunit ribosomal protein L1
MATHGKKYNKVKAGVEDKVYDLAEAIRFLKANKIAKFDETAELAIRLGVDTKKTDQTVRGTVGLPHGTGKKIRIAVFAAGAAADAARAAGADVVGNEDLIEKVKGGWTEFDVAIATPDAMKEVRKLGKVLGPRGLMPNPKTGTVTDDTASAVRDSKAGRVEYRMDRSGNVQVPFGRLSFDEAKLLENVNVLIVAIRAARPAAAKGTFIKRCTLSSTMGVGLRVDVRD